MGPPLDGSLVDAIIGAGGDSLPGVLVPTLLDRGGGQLAFRRAADCCGERVSWPEVAELELFVVVAVGDDVGMVRFAASGHADVQRTGGGS